MPGKRGISWHEEVLLPFLLACAWNWSPYGVLQGQKEYGREVERERAGAGREKVTSATFEELYDAFDSFQRKLERLGNREWEMEMK